jgi:sugar (pentulose or hexulose) kinase
MLGDISYREIDEECEKRKAAECGLFFLPDKNKTFYDLSLSHDRFDLARAVMEGVAFAARNRLERLGCRPKEIRFTGGASKSPFWSRLTADIIGLPLVIPDINDTACLGAAVLAGVGSGVFSDAAEGCARLSTEEKRVLPDAERVKIYNEAYKKYSDIAGRL